MNGALLERIASFSALPGAASGGFVLYLQLYDGCCSNLTLEVSGSPWIMDEDVGGLSSLFRFFSRLFLCPSLVPFFPDAGKEN